ncbi:MAG TPA: TlpA family protein disulfide reductase [Firmicutes bacterium]|nr:TlpA family protein disulfide reductase [Bacillota bacterium]
MKSKMKWIILAVSLVAVIAGATVLYQVLSKSYNGDNLMPNSQTRDPASGESAYAAPDFTVLDADGNEVQLSDYRGKPVVLNFWATWCYYCKVEMPDFDKAYEKYPDVQFLMVNATDGVQETMASAKEYIAQEGFGFDVFFDTELQAVNAYYVTGFPSTFFIDENGSLVTYSSGMLDFETLEKGIQMIRITAQ